MTDDEEFAARAQLKWTRDGDAWISLYRRRRMGPRGPQQGSLRHVAIDQCRRHPKRHGQPVPVQR
jgi:hypothetical protein